MTVGNGAIYAETRERVAAGSSEPGATVTAPDAYELLRCLYSRRSRAQVAALAWDDDPQRYLDTFGRFPFAEQDIIE